MTINHTVLRGLLLNLTASLHRQAPPVPGTDVDTGLDKDQSKIIITAWMQRDIIGMWDAAAAWTDGAVSLADLLVPGVVEHVRSAELRDAIASTAGVTQPDPWGDTPPDPESPINFATEHDDSEAPVYADDPDYRPAIPPHIRAQAEAAAREPKDPEVTAKLAALRARLLGQAE